MSDSPVREAVRRHLEAMTAEIRALASTKETLALTYNFDHFETGESPFVRTYANNGAFDVVIRYEPWGRGP